MYVQQTKNVIFISTELVTYGTLYQSLTSAYPSVQSNNTSNLISGNTSQQITTLIILINYTPFVCVAHLHLSIYLSISSQLSPSLIQTVIINECL